MYKLIAAVSVLAVASANAIQEKPLVESSSSEHETKGHFPNKGWEISDWVVGLTIGAYAPLMSMSRDADCFSAWYNWAITCIEFSKYFDRKFAVDHALAWVGLVLHMFMFTHESVHLVEVCHEELDHAKETKWHENYGFLADLDIPRVSSEAAAHESEHSHYDRNSVSFNVFKVLEIGIGAFSIYENYESAFWFWGLGLAMGKLASNLFVAIDVWTDAGVITPMPAYTRYLEH